MTELEKAARNADWQQVVLNGGPPCFHLDGERFCLRAERWEGHGTKAHADHAFVPLTALVARLARAEQGQWQPIETAPKDRIKLHKQGAVGGWKHQGYGWIWGELQYHPDKHHEHGGYFIVKGGEPTHWTTLPSASGDHAPGVEMKAECYPVDTKQGRVWEIREKASHRPITDLENRTDAHLITAALNQYDRTRSAEHCLWLHVSNECEDYWDGACGVKWCLGDDGKPGRDDANYCPKCGRKLKESPS